MFAGGIGATPLIAVMRDMMKKIGIMNQNFDSSKLDFDKAIDVIGKAFQVDIRYPRRVHLVWSTREEISLDWFARELKTMSDLLEGSKSKDILKVSQSSERDSSAD